MFFIPGMYINSIDTFERIIYIFPEVLCKKIKGVYGNISVELLVVYKFL